MPIFEWMTNLKIGIFFTSCCCIVHCALGTGIALFGVKGSNERQGSKWWNATGKSSGQKPGAEIVGSGGPFPWMRWRREVGGGGVAKKEKESEGELLEFGAATETEFYVKQNAFTFLRLDVRTTEWNIKLISLMENCLKVRTHWRELEDMKFRNYLVYIAYMCHSYVYIVRNNNMWNEDTGKLLYINCFY